jgi:hypothetical protein
VRGSLRWIVIAVVTVVALLVIGLVVFGTGGEESGPFDPSGTITR